MTELVEDVLPRLLTSEWQTEQRAGVPHLKPGQVVAERARLDDGEEVYALVWPQALGHVLLFALVVPDPWRLYGDEDDPPAIGRFMRSTGWVGFQPPSDGFRLSDRQLEALERARA